MNRAEARAMAKNITDQDWGIALLLSAERTDRALAGWYADTSEDLTNLAHICEIASEPEPEP